MPYPLTDKKVYGLIAVVVIIVALAAYCTAKRKSMKGGRDAATLFRTSNDTFAMCKSQCDDFINSSSCEDCRCQVLKKDWMKKCNEDFLKCNLDQKMCVNNLMVCRRNHSCSC